MIKIIKIGLGKFLKVLLIFSIVTGWIFSGWPQIWDNPSIPLKPEIVQAATRTIEQQINIINQEYTCTEAICWNSGTAKPNDSSLGLILWDGSKYNGETVYFEVVIKTSTGDNVFAALFTGGSLVTNSTVTTTNGSYTKLRSASITLIDSTSYSVRVWADFIIGDEEVTIQSARLIIVQSDGTSITNTQTQVEVGNNETSINTSYTDLTDKKIYRYTSGNFSAAPTINFEATIKIAGTSEGTPTDSGPNDPATGAEDTTVGETSWESYTDSYSNNATYDGVSLDKGKIGYYNKATNFSFSGIPSDATIKGIKVEINGYVSNTLMDDSSVKIVKGGTITGNDLADGGTDWPTSDDGTYRSYGGSTNLWGTTWSSSDIDSNSGFGVVFAFINNKTGGPATYTGYIDHIRITVTYTPAVTETAYAALYTTGGSEVTDSAVLTTNSSWTRVRSASPITLSDATDYVVRIKTSNASITASIANAKIILDQSAAGGIDKLEIVHQYVNTLKTDTDSTYTLQNFDNEYNPSNWVGGTFNYYFEATMKTSTGTGYAQLYNVSDSDAIDTSTNSELSSTSTSYERKKSADLSGNSDWPSAAKTLDTQIKNASTDTTSVSSSWLIINVSGLASASGPTLTFAITDVAIGFGTLVAANARFASGDASGTDGPTSASAHTMTVATNATSGYTVTYNGATLTSGSDTIDVATIAGDEDGTPGGEQFAIGFTTDGDATITTAYDQVSPTFKYTFVTSTTTAIITESGPTATETFSAFYLANISGATEAGSYSTSIVYIASANF